MALVVIVSRISCSPALFLKPLLGESVPPETSRGEAVRRQSLRSEELGMGNRAMKWSPVAICSPGRMCGYLPSQQRIEMGSSASKVGEPNRAEIRRQNLFEKSPVAARS